MEPGSGSMERSGAANSYWRLGTRLIASRISAHSLCPAAMLPHGNPNTPRLVYSTRYSEIKHLMGVSRHCFGRCLKKMFVAHERRAWAGFLTPSHRLSEFEMRFRSK